MLALEYGVLGALAGAVGSVGALGLSWVLTRQVFEVAWFARLLRPLEGYILTALVVGVVGVVSSIDVLRRKPAGHPQSGVRLRELGAGRHLRAKIGGLGSRGRRQHGSGRLQTGAAFEAR